MLEAAQNKNIYFTVKTSLITAPASYTEEKRIAAVEITI